MIKMKIAVLVFCFTGIILADSYILAPNGTYVSGNRAVLSSSGSYVGNESLIIHTYKAL